MAAGRLGLVGALAFLLVAPWGAAAREPAEERKPQPPAEIAAALGRGALADWLRALQAIDSTVSAGSFAAPAESRLTPAPWPRVLRSEQMRRKAAFGVLIPSPDSALVLDPLTGFEFDSQGQIGADADLGFSLFLRKSGAQTFHWVSTSDLMVAAAWVDSARVVIVGESRIDRSRGKGLRFDDRPAIWVVDAAAGRMTRYLGPRVPTARRSEWRHALRDVRERAYPRVRDWP